MTKRNHDQPHTNLPFDLKEPSQTRIPRWLRWTGLQGKTLWDLLALLVVPLMLAIVGFAFTLMQDTRDKKIENERQAAQTIIEENRTNDSILQSYLDDMTTLMLNEGFIAAVNVENGECPKSNEKYQQAPILLARSRSLVVLNQLGEGRSGPIVRFLGEGGLLGLVDCELRYVNLAGIDLRNVALANAYLSAANLSNADLSDARLQGADLHDADLSGANLSRADLSETNLYRVGLNNASLSDAHLSNANLYEADLNGADLSGAKMTGVRMFEADLNGADLQGADLQDASLGGADLNGANLSGANLQGVNLTEADLGEAQFDEETILPDGSHWSPGWSPEATPESAADSQT